MIKLLPILLACLLALSATQTCSSSSVAKIQSGVLNLGVSASPSTSFTQIEYVQTLGGNLGIAARIHNAFAIAGFQASCTQTSYVLKVDKVIFQNTNTKMRFTMDYNRAAPTQWTRIKLTYLLVADTFESFGAPEGGNYIWADSVQITIPIASPSGLYTNVSIFSLPPSGVNVDVASTCGYLQNLPNARFDTLCTNSDTFIPHYYIMGFQFTPGALRLAAMAQINNYLTTALGVVFGNGGAQGYGPLVKTSSFGGSLRKIKIAMVLTLLRGGSPSAAQSFGYSGIYMPIDLENSDAAIIQGTAIGMYNRERWNLAKPTYAIYGLSSFVLNSNSKCLAIDIDVTLKDLFTIILNTDNTDDLNSVIVSGDFFSKTAGALCGGNSGLTRTMTEVPNINYSTVPDLLMDLHDIRTTSQNPLTWRLSANPSASSSLSIAYTINAVYEKFIVGNTYKFVVNLRQGASWITAFSRLLVPSRAAIRFMIEADGIILNDATISEAVGSSNLLSTGLYTITFGYIAKTTKPSFKFVVVTQRPVDDNTADLILYPLIMDLDVVASQFTTVYTPSTDCCDTKCAADSGVFFGTSPPSCITCTGVNLSYNSLTGFCSCKSRFYNILEGVSGAGGGLVCFPCLANLCAICAAPTVINVFTCRTCIVGATLNTSTNLCSCSAGFFEINGDCRACPSKCNGCSVADICNACADTINRKLENGCACNPGFFDDGTATCKTCNPICKTCSSATACTDCFSENNRTLINGRCVCASGFFQVVNSDNTVTCRKCSFECKECENTNTCLDCRPETNRIIGYDQQNHMTCLCLPGFVDTKDGKGSCVQNGCSADRFCQDCDDARGTKVCIQCLASSNRILAIPEYACLCKEGFFDDAGTCKPCSSGCAKCANATVCERCAVASTDNRNGSCNCPATFFFATEPIRFCKRCNQYCLQCSSNNNCDTCLPGFSATNNGQCICPRGSFVNSNLQCVNCIGNCTVCTSQDACTLCATGFFVQDGRCVTRCNVGFFISGAVCQRCQDGCSHCERPATCLICQAGRYSFNGLCYINCPDGAIASTSDMTCLACNAPCRTCVQHPSKCLTCLTGNFFEFTCTATCPVGTFSQNGICKYCSFQCAGCLGNANTCIACPDGQFLFEGRCSLTCPVPLVAGRCPNICPAGFFTQTGTTNCLRCNSRCKQCGGSADSCTSCVTGLASNGACVQTCPTNTLNVNGNCQACSEGCNGCTESIDRCAACQPGFVLTGSRCFSQCAEGSFRDTASNTCRRCPLTCKSCSSANFCNSCVEAKSTPINGVCSGCASFCSGCQSFDVCTSCQQGFVLFESRCVNACPRDSSLVNGVCRCTSGLTQEGACVASCSSSFTNINGKCEKCAANCGACAGTVKTCTSCNNGFILNAVAGECQINRNCQQGQYYSVEERICKRICPNGFSYENAMCVTECSPGLRDNGFGGCVLQGAVSGCSFPLFFQQGTCVSSCNAGTFPNSRNRVCEACSSNCFACLSSAFCTSCSSGFDLKNTICVTGQRCVGTRVKYNGVCVDSCPVGTVASNGFCERRCDPQSYFSDGKCYTTCPSNLRFRTDVACISSCPSGYTADGNVCKLASQSCPSGQFYNLQTAQCSSCSFPCAQCQYTQTTCTLCAAGTTLTGGRCVPANSCGSGRFRTAAGVCSACPVKCAECVSQNLCDTCAIGYEFNGDCVIRTATLKEVTMVVSSVLRRSNTVFVSLRLNIIPNGLSNEQKNNFFIVIASENDKVSKVNQFLSQTDPNTVIVAVEYSQYPSTISSLFIAQNAVLLSSSYAAIGFRPALTGYLPVTVSSGLNQAPASLIIPQGVTNNRPDSIFKLTINSQRTAAQKSAKDVL